MRTAVFMRHGHADDGVDDHGRALNARGRAAARAAADELLATGFVPDVIVCSSAERARTTAEIARSVLSSGRSLDARRELYLAEPAIYLDTVRALPDECRRALLVAHNPGLEDLAVRFGKDDRLAPAGYFVVQRDVDRWSDFAP